MSQQLHIRTEMSGSHSDTLSHLAVDVWRWCIVRNIVIHAENIPGRENVLVPTHVGLQRLDAGPECINGTRREVWTILDGSLCHHEQTIMSQPTAAGLGAGSRQLNTPFRNMSPVDVVQPVYR